jgi:hypothetical protein
LEDLMTMVRLQFSPDSALDCCLDVAREIKKLAEHDEVNQNIVSFLFVTSKGCHTVLRLKTPGQLYEYHLVNLSERKRIVCTDVYALFRLLHRVYMFEMNNPDDNPAAARGLRNRSLLYRICGKLNTPNINDDYVEEMRQPIGLPGVVEDFDEPDSDNHEENGTDEEMDDEDMGGFDEEQSEDEDEDNQDADSDEDDDDDNMGGGGGLTRNL